MTINVKFFASLRENLGLDHVSVDASNLATVADVWAAATDGQPLPEQALCAVNQDHTELSAAVKDGDEIAFFPPVTGG